jgi:tetratricopeptide (TPR) repeat protein
MPWTEDQVRLYRRVFAAAGLGLLLSGLLMALSLVFVGLVLSCVTLGVLLVAGFGWLRGRIEITPAVQAMRTAVPKPRARIHARNVARRGGALTRRALSGSVGAMYRVGLVRRHSVDPGRLARELNRRGAQLRREGEADQAAEQHRAALAIVRDLGDQRAEAMTLNNLGLALAHSGAERAAVEYLEQAADVLRGLGDDEHEGQVIANLGLVYRRQGQGDEAAVLFHEALDKLPRTSPAYRRVQRELLRAS